MKTDRMMYIGPPRSEAERDERNPKVRYAGKLYRIHKEVRHWKTGDKMLRLITMDGESTVDVYEAEVTPA
jgi:hypothetical protein